jgi:hypothetical protein
LPLFYANDIQESPVLFYTFKFALYDSNISTVYLFPSLHAYKRGVLPYASNCSISEPSSIKLRAHANLLFSIARVNGVLYWISKGSTPAPRLISANRTFSAPNSAAKWMGVFSSWFYLNYKLTSSPWSKYKLVTSSLSALISFNRAYTKSN